MELLITSYRLGPTNTELMMLSYDCSASTEPLHLLLVQI